MTSRRAGCRRGEAEAREEGMSTSVNVRDPVRTCQASFSSDEAHAAVEPARTCRARQFTTLSIIAQGSMHVNDSLPFGLRRSRRGDGGAWAQTGPRPRSFESASSASLLPAPGGIHATRSAGADVADRLRLPAPLPELLRRGLGDSRPYPVADDEQRLDAPIVLGSEAHCSILLYIAPRSHLDRACGQPSWSRSR